MIAALVWGAALACPGITVAELSEIPAPSILILGERHGDRQDLRLARRAVRHLARRGPVTLALEAAHSDHADAVAAFNAGDTSARALRPGLRWEQTWGFAWQPYRRLFATRRVGVRFVAAGLKLGPPPEGREVAIPDGYGERLAAVLAAHGGALDDAAQARFARSMAWRDLRIGELAVAGWGGDGVLVILTGRGHVEGGVGTAWQLARVDPRPIQAALLAAPSACEPGDRLLRR